MSQISDVSKQADATSSCVPIHRLTEILLASLASLAKSGEVETTCRLAGQAYMALRNTDQIAARRFDVLLHRLTAVAGSHDRSVF